MRHPATDCEYRVTVVNHTADFRRLRCQRAWKPKNKGTYKTLPGALILCLSLLLFSCPMQSDSGMPSTDTSISQLTAGGLLVAEDAPGHFSVYLDSDVAQITIIITTAQGASTTVTMAGAPISATEGNTFHLTSLVAGANSYLITVEAENTASTKDYTLVITKASLPPTVLPDVIALRSPANSAIGIGAAPVLSWERSKGAVYWKIYFAEGSMPSTGAASGDQFLTKPEWTAPDLEQNLTYAWKVIPYDYYGSPLESSESWIFTTGQTPLAPASLSITPIDGKPHLALQWEASTTADGYKIFRNGATTPVFVSPSETILSMIDTAPNSGLNTYTIRAFNSFGDSVSAASADGTPSAGGSIIIIFK